MKNGKAGKKGKSRDQKYKITAKEAKKLAFRLVVGLFVVLAIVLVPTLCVYYPDIISNRFSPRLAAYQGVVELWNIDSFEGGTGSKSGFLQTRAMEYQEQNKGFYVLVRNMTETECLLALQNGQRPAMFSFGVGVASELKEYLASITLSKNTNIRKEFVSAATIDGKIYAVPWCRGVYSLISTTSNLAAVGITDSALSDIALMCGYTKNLSNGKTKTVYSLAFGGNGYISPQAAFGTNYGILAQTETSYRADYDTLTSYNAYCDFIEGKASILLGTQRDIARIENRISLGKIDGVVYQHITSYTDLLQYIAISNSAAQEIYNQCSNFVSFLTSETCQLKLANIGMFSVSNLSKNLYSAEEWLNIELLCSQTCTVQPLFSSKQEISASKAQYIKAISA